MIRGVRRHIQIGRYRCTVEDIRIKQVAITVYLGDIIQEQGLTQPDIDWTESVKELQNRIMQYAARVVCGMPTERVDPRVQANTNGIHVTIYTTTGPDDIQVIGVKADIGADLLTDAITDDLIEALAQFPGWSDTSWVVRVEEGEA